MFSSFWILFLETFDDCVLWFFISLLINQLQWIFECRKQNLDWIISLLFFITIIHHWWRFLPMFSAVNNYFYLIIIVAVFWFNNYLHFFVEFQYIDCLKYLSTKIKWMMIVRSQTHKRHSFSYCLYLNNNNNNHMKTATIYLEDNNNYQLCL